MKKRMVLLLFILLFLSSAISAKAEMRRGFEIGLFGGTATASAGIQKNFFNGLRKISSNISDGGLYGFRMGGNFNRYFGLEFNFANSETGYNAYLFNRDNDILSSEENTSIGLLNFNVLLNFPLGAIVPFVTGGKGWALFMDYSLPATNYGVGAKIFFSRRLFLCFDLKEYIISGEQKISEVDYDGEFYEYPYYYNDNIRLKEISGGLSLLF